MAKFPVLPFQFLDPILLGTCQPGALTGIAFGLLAPGAQAVRRAAQLRRNRPIGRVIAGVFTTMVAEKPNTAFAQFGRIGGG